jgi:pimeloyl-ACP methyl ester carboxylesterase
MCSSRVTALTTPPRRQRAAIEVEAIRVAVVLFAGVSVYIEEHGQGDAAMLLLHGIGATGAVWRRAVIELVDMWTGRIVVCDLPGHGHSAALATYSYPSVAETIARATPPRESLVVVGHSFGGVIATMLASGRYGVEPDAVVASSVKVTWSAEELAGFATLASKPVRWFTGRGEAENRYRKVSGLTVDVTDDPADLERGVCEDDQGFRLSNDPATGAVGAPDMTAALADADCAVLLIRGARDPMVTKAELQAFGVATVDIADAGHNVHVEQPELFARSVIEFVADRTS